MKPIFSVDFEPWFCGTPYGKYWEENEPLVEEPTLYLLDLLRRHNIKAIFYVLGWLADKCPDLYDAIKAEGHVIGWHTYYHSKAEVSDVLLKDPLFRPPRWHGTRRLYSGGFFFRAMPYWWSKREIQKEGMLFVHPYDTFRPDEEPTGKLHRRIGLSDMRDKLERLCREVEFSDANTLCKSS